MSDARLPLRLSLSSSAMALVPPGRLRSLANTLADGQGAPVLVSVASDVLAMGSAGVPAWVDAETRHLVVADVPEPAILRLPALFELHKPHLRLHVSRDTTAVKRLVLAQMRVEPWEGIVDAYPLGRLLVVVHGDMAIREYPQTRLPRLRQMARDAFAVFDIDESGSFLHWDEGDIHMGASQLLQAVDPMYLTDVEIQRYARQKVSLALLAMRQERGLKQTDIPGLSDRHVRRLENEEARLTTDAAQAFADAFGIELSVFLSELGTRLAILSDPDAVADGPNHLVGAG